jgi:outer membrane receptor for ferrienterochelin and colicins
MIGPAFRPRAPRHQRGGRGVPASLLVVMLAVSSSAHAQTALPDLSIEDLMTLDAGQVFGASERLQPVLEAPASVSFITAAEIARYGYRTLADILRSVRGMYVTDDRNFSSLGTRGFAKPGDFNNRVLLLVNGHRVNDNISDGAEIGAEFFLDPAIFERVEIIRGPASSLYGDSAFFAVVNVITRTGASLGGGSIALEAGTLGTQLLRATEGRRFANGVDVALSGTYQRSDGVGRLYYPAFDSPATNHGVAEGLDGEGVRHFYGRLDFKDLTVTAGYGRRQRDVPTASRGTVFNAQASREETIDRHALIDAAYQRSFGASRVTFRGSFDRFTFDAILPLTVGQGGAPALVAHSDGLGTRWTVGAGLMRPLRGRQTVTAGAELIDNVHQDQSSNFVDPPVPLSDSRGSSTQHAVYMQDEIKIARWLIVNGGVRFDAYEAFTRVTPRAAVIVLPSSKQSVKYLYGSAFRAPNAYEQNDFLFGDRVLNLQPESIDTHELVWERYANDWLRTSVSTYWYNANRLITAIPDASTRGAISYVNGGDVRAKGLELEAQMRLRGESRALVSYALQDAEDRDTHVDVPNSPRHMVKARISVPGPMGRSFVSMEGQYLSSRATLAGSRVSAAATLDGTLVQPLSRSWELYGGVRNIFDAQYADPAPSPNRQDTIVQNGRTARIGLRWTKAATP